MDTKLESVATCNLYVAAPVATFHVSVGFIAIFVSPFDGVARVGVAGIGTTAVKFHMAEYWLVPPMFVAFTRQKYLTLLVNGPIALCVVVSVESCTTNDTKFESVATCSLYVDTPAEAFHVRVGLIDMPVAPSEGVASVGTAGAATIVVKLRYVEYALVPAVFVAYTRQ